jgi:hypothetical protein
MPATCDSTETDLKASPVPMARNSTGMGLTTALAARIGTESATGAGVAFSAQPVSSRRMDSDRTTLSCSWQFIFRNGWTRRATAVARLHLPAASNFFQIIDYTIENGGKRLAPQALQFASRRLCQNVFGIKKLGTSSSSLHRPLYCMHDEIKGPRRTQSIYVFTRSSVKFP